MYCSFFAFQCPNIDHFEQSDSLAKDSNFPQDYYATISIAVLALTVLVVSCTKIVPSLCLRRFTLKEGESLSISMDAKPEKNGSEEEDKLQYKEISLPYGEIQRGMFKNDVLNGPGEVKYPNGKTEKGMFLEGVLNGEGEIEYAKGGGYKGMFKNGKPHGRGVKSLPDGTLFEGEFVEGAFDGWFKITYLTVSSSQVSVLYDRGKKIQQK